jgi:acetyl-CoA acetyltransferase
MNSCKIADPLTLYQCCSTSEGGTAAIVIAKDLVNNLVKDRKCCISIIGAVLRTQKWNSEEEWEMEFDGEMDISGSLPVNTDGGLQGMGHPFGATGIRMIHKLRTQLREEARARQVRSASIGLAQNSGAGGVATVFIVSK